MRRVYVVTYDISNPKRLRGVYKLMQGYGDHVQFSVFCCALSASDLVELKGRLSAVIHHQDDQVLFFDLGPEQGRGSTCAAYVGRPMAPRTAGPVVV
ncbi:MAG: CRISPR-associated endonuclease Cas2 [Polyangiaceae bacterium]|nr:CRISPR-associated endonuclease Cas2 [Polyangiaceae bacterium]MCW5790476.1 CRISPR-associated endonuclease Cas2 [Polyangiaceae bacterium]